MLRYYKNKCSQSSLRDALADARREACYVVRLDQDQSPIYDWSSLLNLIQDPEVRYEEAQLAYDCSYQRSPFRTIAGICLTRAEEDMRRQPTAKYEI